MTWLAALKKMESPPIDSLHKLQKPVSVVSVGRLARTLENPNSTTVTFPANTDPAKKDAESDEIHAARLALFTDRGLSLDDAEFIADKLGRRDFEHDERRLCIECQHLSGGPNA